jgi:hypothetical protein
MNKFKNCNTVFVLVFVLVFIFVSCKHNLKPADKTIIIANESEVVGYNDFEHFLASFKPLAINNLNDLGLLFNDHYLAKDNALVEVSQKHKEVYLRNLNNEYMYYGFKTELPYTSVMLTFLKHYGADNLTGGDVIDTTFFVSHVFSGSGELQSSFRSFGSNLTGEPPTYNMISTFEHEDERLIIINNEYSTGLSYSEATPLPGSDSIYQADLTRTIYHLNYNTNEIVLVNKLKSKAKVVESTRNPLPAILKPVE